MRVDDGVVDEVDESLSSSDAFSGGEDFSRRIMSSRASSDEGGLMLAKESSGFSILDEVLEGAMALHNGSCRLCCSVPGKKEM